MRLLDVPNYDPESIKPTCIVTLHQFMTYFKEEGGLQHVDAVANESKQSIILCLLNLRCKLILKYGLRNYSLIIIWIFHRQWHLSTPNPE